MGSAEWFSLGCLIKVASSFLCLVPGLGELEQLELVGNLFLHMALTGFLTAWLSQRNQTSYMAVGFSQMECSKNPGRSCMATYDLASEVTQHHFCHILLVQVVWANPNSRNWREELHFLLEARLIRIGWEGTESSHL